MPCVRAVSGCLAMAVLQPNLFGILLVYRRRGKVVRVEDLIAGQAAHVVDAVAPHQKLSFLVLTIRHRRLYTLF